MGVHTGWTFPFEVPTPSRWAWHPAGGPLASLQDFVYHAALGAVGQRVALAVGEVGQPIVVDAEEVEQGGVVVVGADGIDDGAVADVVGGSVGHAPFDAAAGQPNA